MNHTKRFIINVALILTVSVIGSFFMMAFDHGGTQWLKFVLYVGFFASLFSPLFFSSSSSCSLLLNHLRKRI